VWRSAEARLNRNRWPNTTVALTAGEQRTWHASGTDQAAAERLARKLACKSSPSMTVTAK
jgi:hypothetical protein